MLEQIKYVFDATFNFPNSLLYLSFACAGLVIIFKYISIKIDDSSGVFSFFSYIFGAFCFLCLFGGMDISTKNYSQFLANEGDVIEVSDLGTLSKNTDTVVCGDGKSVCEEKIQFTIHSSVVPITPNPKVRKISYNVQTSIGSQRLLAQAFLGKTNVVQPIRRTPYTEPGQYLTGDLKEYIEDVITYQLHEFNNAHSIELSELYNPLDLNQQERFNSLLQSFLVPALAVYGIKLDSGIFEVENS